MKELAKWSWIIFLGLIVLGGWYFVIFGVGFIVMFLLGWYKAKHDN